MYFCQGVSFVQIWNLKQFAYNERLLLMKDLRLLIPGKTNKNVLYYTKYFWHTTTKKKKKAKWEATTIDRIWNKQMEIYYTFFFKYTPNITGLYCIPEEFFPVESTAN